MSAYLKPNDWVEIAQDADLRKQWLAAFKDNEPYVAMALDLADALHLSREEQLEVALAIVTSQMIRIREGKPE